MKLQFIIISLFLLQQTVTAQSLFVFKGRVFDISTNEPLSYATISIPNTGTGVISNQNGEFIYHMPNGVENRLIEISFLGYEPVFIDFDTTNANIIYPIGMHPKTVEIDEVKITAEKLVSVNKVVRQAIRSISKNYPKDVYQIYGYYRDYIRDLNRNDFNNLTEAAVIIEDKGYNTKDYKNTKIKIEQIRYVPGIASDTVLNIGYDGVNKYVPNATIGSSNDLSQLLLHNPIRNHKSKTFSFVDYFDISFIQNHEFHFQSIIKNDSTEIYEIVFDTHRLLGLMLEDEYWAEGTIHIKSDDNAILKFTYTVYKDSPSFSGKFFDLKLEYKRYLDKYYLSYISMNNYFEFAYQTFGMYEPKIEHMYQFRELFINKIITEIDQPIIEEEAIDKEKMLMSNKIPVDLGFWDNYNYVINEKLIEE